MRFPTYKLAALGIAFLAATAICGAANAGPSICDAVPGNLVQNCGFETGDFTNWTATPAASGSNFFVGGPGQSGNFNAWFGATNLQVDTISQGIATIPGHLYELNFQFISDGSTPNFLVAGYFDGSFQFLGGGPVPQVGWTPADFFFVSGTSAIGLIFGGFDSESYLGLDDVVLRDVTPVPEPFTFSIFGVGLVGAVGVRRARYLKRKLLRTK